MSRKLSNGSAFIPHERVPADVGGPSLTRQEFAEECDLNALMARYEKSGVWPGPMPGTAPAYFDAADVPTDFREVMDAMNEAQVAFMSLPAVVRREFDNDPAAFVEYAQSGGDEVVKRMREWGLCAPEVVPDPPMRVEVVNPPPAPDAPSGGS